MRKKLVLLFAARPVSLEEDGALAISALYTGTFYRKRKSKVTKHFSLSLLFYFFFSWRYNPLWGFILQPSSGL